MSIFLKSSTISLQPGVLMDPNFNSQNVEDSYKRPAEYDIQSVDVLWPRSQGSQGQFNTKNVSGNAAWYNWPRADSGSRSCLIISGITRDQNGAVLANCNIDCFTTADDVKQSTVLSSNVGAFSAPTYSSGTHYLVAYKATSPSNLAGSTDINISGA